MHSTLYIYIYIYIVIDYSLVLYSLVLTGNSYLKPNLWYCICIPSVFSTMVLIFAQGDFTVFKHVIDTYQFIMTAL